MSRRLPERTPKGRRGTSKQDLSSSCHVACGLTAVQRVSQMSPISGASPMKRLIGASSVTKHTTKNNEKSNLPLCKQVLKFSQRETLKPSLVRGKAAQARSSARLCEFSCLLCSWGGPARHFHARLRGPCFQPMLLTHRAFNPQSRHREARKSARRLRKTKGVRRRTAVTGWHAGCAHTCRPLNHATCVP